MKKNKMDSPVMVPEQSDLLLVKGAIKREKRTKNVLVSIFLSKQEEKLFEDASRNSMENEKVLVCNPN